MPISTFKGIRRLASFRNKSQSTPKQPSQEPETNPTSGGKDKENSEAKNWEEDQKNCKSSKDQNENSKTSSNNPTISSAVSRKRSPNTRTSSGGGGGSEESSSKSKRHLGLSTADNQQQQPENKDNNSNHKQEECSTVVGGGGESKSGDSSNEDHRNKMETDACATEIEETGKVSSTSAASSNASSGYSSSRSNKTNVNTPKPHLSRGMSKSAGESSSSGANGKENRVPSSLMASHSQARGVGDSSLSPIPVIKNRPQRSFVGYVSPYEQFLRFTETDPKYRSEKSQGKILGLYKFCGEIGSGNFSKVKLGIHQLTKERVAIKIIEKSRVQEKMERMLSREVRSMEVLNHPNLIRLYEVMETGTKIYLISEWAPAGDLYSKVTLRGKLPEYDAKPIFTQILAALLYMHGNGIIHRDLKAENVFFSTATVCKVGDFGFSTTGYKGQLLCTFCGSPPYAAPELYRDEAYEGGPVDAWALGVLLYFMTEGRLPFIGTSIPNLKRNILNGEYMMSGNLSDELMDLIQKILQQRPSRRLTVAEIIIHPWLAPDVYGSQIFSANTSTDSSQADSSLGSIDGSESICSTMSTRQDHCSIIRRDTNGKLFPTTKNRAICRSIPTKEQILYKLVSPKEIQAYEILLDIGIPETMIEAHRPRGVRSYVIGIYRMLLHKLEKGDEIDFAKFCAHSMSSSMTNFNGSAGGHHHHHEIIGAHRYETNAHHHPPQPNKGPVKMNTNNSPVRYKEEGEEDAKEEDQTDQNEGDAVTSGSGNKGGNDLGDLGLDEIRKSQLKSSKLSKTSQAEDIEAVVNNCQAVPSTTCAIL